MKSNNELHHCATVDDFISEDLIKNIPEFRAAAFNQATAHKVLVFQDKFMDLFSWINGQWHYITTKK
jgi:hypothetical protein